MKINNYSYYMTVDSRGLKFVKCDTSIMDDSEYRLQELNELNLRFVMAISVKHQISEVNVVIAIFEEVLNG